MNSYPEPQDESDPELAPVVYEQPLNERMRTFLRLEFLYTQATYHSELDNSWSSRAAVSSLLEILAITARGDSRSDVLKELERHVNVLKEYQSKTGVDPSRLKSLMSNLIKLREDLSTVGGNYMAPLRDSEFLSAIKHRSAIPGGTCDFDLPDYSYWLNRPAYVRAAEFGSLAGVDPAAVRQHRGASVADPAECQAQSGNRGRRHFPAAVRSRESLPVGARHAAGGQRTVSRDQRQPASLHHPLPELDRCHQPPGSRGNGRAVPSDLLLLIGAAARWQPW